MESELRIWINMLTEIGALAILVLLIFKVPVWFALNKEGKIEVAKQLAETNKQIREDFLITLEKNEKRCSEQHNYTLEIVNDLADNIKENTVVTRELSNRLKS